jgi:polyvinyl alcohol dehydrogenase (cytochrome)
MADSCHRPFVQENLMKPEIEKQTALEAHPRRARLRAVGLLVGASLALCATAAPATRADDDDQEDCGNWPMYNHDRSGTRFNSEENTLRASNIAGLHVKWQRDTPAPVSGTPVVVDNTVYAGDLSGKFYALKSDGTLLWSTQLLGPITASALVTGNMLVLGDISGNLYGLNRKTGAAVWSFRPDPHPVAAIWGSPTKIGSNVAVGVASNEETAAGDPTYPCCSSRGSLVLLNPKTGAVVWQTPTITNAERASGASGASIWSSPTYDAARNLIYVTTGNNFSQPTNGTSDAIIAFNARTGAIKWVNQRQPNDEWNFRFPASPDHPDADFGDSPQVYNLSNGRRVVGAGQKSGFYHVVDATTGVLINQNQVEVGGLLGGLFADTAVANGIVFANGINWPGINAGEAPVAGDLIALSGDGSQELWRFTTPSSPDVAGVAVANSIVYFTSSFAQKLYGLSAATGAKLVEVPLSLVSYSGPAISRGQIYVGTGDAVQAFGAAQSLPGAIVALGL